MYNTNNAYEAVRYRGNLQRTVSTCVRPHSCVSTARLKVYLPGIEIGSIPLGQFNLGYYAHEMISTSIRDNSNAMIGSSIYFQFYFYLPYIFPTEYARISANAWRTVICKLSLTIYRRKEEKIVITFYIVTQLENCTQ